MIASSAWALILTTSLTFGITYEVLRREGHRLAERRKLIEACLPSSAEQAEFFARCWAAERDR